MARKRKRTLRKSDYVMKVSEIRAMAVSEAKKQLAELRTELAKEKAVAAGGTRPENPGKIRSLRRNIARFLTVIRSKEIGEKEDKEEKKESKEKKDAVKKVKAKKLVRGKRKAKKAKVKKKIKKRTIRTGKKTRKKKSRSVRKKVKAKKKEVKKA